jgi:hypothetical protein
VKVIFGCLLIVWFAVATCTGSYVLIDGALGAVVRRYAGTP